MAKDSNETVLPEADTKRLDMNRIRKGERIFSDHLMKREKLEHFVTSGKIKGKQSSRLIKWLGVGRETDVQKA